LHGTVRHEAPADLELTMNRLCLVPAALLACCAIAACGGTAAVPPAAAAASAAVPRPLGVQDPVPSPSAATNSGPACDPRASLRPQGALPAPGAMPAGSTMARILARGRLIVGADQDAYLMGFRDPSTGRLAGFDIDIARQVAKAVFGNPDAIQFRAINAADRIPMIQSGDVDLVVRRMTITCDRLQQVSFSTDYLDSPQRLLVDKGSGYRSIADLGGKKVCASTASINLPVIQQAPSHPVAVAASNVSDCLIMLQQGQIQGVSTDEVGLIGLAVQDPNTEIVGGPLNDNPIGVAMKKDATDLVRFVNGVLDKIRADGTWTAIYQQWLARGGAVPAPPAARYLD
jgi:polar amino acid transport system substrate-binding protein